MLNIGQAEELAKLKHKLSDYKKLRKKKVSAIEDLEDAINKLQKKRREIEDGLQETENTISKRLDRLPLTCKFRSVYFEQAKRQFLNPKSSKALEHTRESERTAKKKLISIEDEIENLNRKIQKLEEQIRRLSQQAN